MIKTVVVTGDSRGLGNDIVWHLLQENEYNVIGVSRNESEEIVACREQYPERYSHVEFDLAHPESIRSLYEESLKPEGPIYGLVNNAAMAYDDLVTNANVGQLQTMFTVNLISPILLSKFAIRDMMLNRTEGALVHVSSVSTSTGYKGLSMYGATKGALEAFSLSMAREWGKRGIRSNCVAPGFMNTAMTETLSDDQRNRIYARTSLGEPTDMESVAETVEFLLSDAADSITGEVVRIDSGTL